MDRTSSFQTGCTALDRPRSVERAPAPALSRDDDRNSSVCRLVSASSVVARVAEITTFGYSNFPRLGLPDVLPSDTPEA